MRLYPVSSNLFPTYISEFCFTVGLIINIITCLIACMISFTGSLIEKDNPNAVMCSILWSILKRYKWSLHHLNTLVVLKCHTVVVDYMIPYCYWIFDFIGLEAVGK